MSLSNRRVLMRSVRVILLAALHVLLLPHLCRAFSSSSASSALRMVAAEPRLARSAGGVSHKKQPQLEKAPGGGLLYMPFMESALEQMEEMFVLESVPVDKSLALCAGKCREQTGRIMSLAFSAPEFRRARLTYFDAGSAVQVFNMVIYPHLDSQMPIFGADLITFGPKHLAGIDFQPLYDDEDYASKYADRLAPIRSQFPVLTQSMSARFYDSAKFFSKQMLFGRYEEDAVITTQLRPAFESYFSEYTQMLRKEKRDPSLEKAILERQAAYDQYNAERDPAHGLFRQYFGDHWSDRFMDEFLFPLSTRPEGGYPKQPDRTNQQQQQ